MLFADLSACDAYADGVERARSVRCPVLLLLGERDSMTPARAARGLEDALPTSRRLVIRHGGHQLMAERPNQVLDALVEFVG